MTINRRFDDVYTLPKGAPQKSEIRNEKSDGSDKCVSLMEDPPHTFRILNDLLAEHA